MSRSAIATGLSSPPTSPHRASLGTRAAARVVPPSPRSSARRRASLRDESEFVVATETTNHQRSARLEHLERSYVERHAPPPLPPGYFVEIEDPPVGGGKTRVVIRKRRTETETETDGDPAPSRDASAAAGDDPNDVVAWLVCWRKGKANDTLFLSSVEVRKEHRRRGLARRLLWEAESLGAREMRCAEAELTVVKSNAGAIALYEKHGYVVDEVRACMASAGAWGGIAAMFDPTLILQHRMKKTLGVAVRAAAGGTSAELSR